MSRCHMLGWILAAGLLGFLIPQTSQAAEWNFSPYRAQIAQDQSPEEQTTGTETMPADATGKKNIGKAVMFSLIIPGTGQLYGGSWLTAIPWFAIEVAGWAMFASYHGKGQDKTDEFEAFAGQREQPNHFDYRAYLWWEYHVAQDSALNGGRHEFTGTLQDWEGTRWDDRYTYLPAPFTHDVLTGDQQQYFEMIGKYLQQFGWGWQDTYNEGAGGAPTSATAWYIENDQQGDGLGPVWGLTADNPDTRWFDGDSPLFFQYRDMRADANDLLDKGNVAMEVVLVNHVLSALHAAFLVRNHNRHIDQTPKLGDLHIQYDARVDNDGYHTRMLSLTLPLR